MTRQSILGIVVGVLLTAPAAAQTGAQIEGTVLDESGAVVPGAGVTVLHPLNGRSVTVTTGARGDYRVVALLPGAYEIRAERAGFTPALRQIELLVGAHATVDLVLSVTPVAERLRVTPDVALVEPARSQPTSVITSRQIESLPVLERNVLVLAQLLPGSAPINSTNNRFAVTKFGGPADQRSGFTTLVDGGDIDDAQWGSPTINIGQDAVQEFKVLRHQFDAQFGHALNAVVMVATRSGTNQLHGSGFYFGRDDALNARNAFAATGTSFDDQRFGATGGGPLVLNRTHVFGSYERDNVDTVRIIALPAANPFAAAENGTFPAATDTHRAVARLDHRINAEHTLFARLSYDDQTQRRSSAGARSDSSQVDVVNQSTGVVVEETWTPAANLANTVRAHLLGHTLATRPRNNDVGIVRPSISTGQINADSQDLDRTRISLSDVAYLQRARHAFRFGGEFTWATHTLETRALVNGVFRFQTDAAFNPADARTYPLSFSQQEPGTFGYRSREVSAFAQDDWHVGGRLRVNLGLRYDLDLGMRLNSFYEGLLRDPAVAGIEQFVHADRGTDTNNLQPRLGATWDVQGDGTLIARGGWGLYVTRNRPWYQLRSMAQLGSSNVLVTDPAKLRLFPDVTAVLGGLSLDEFVAAGGPRQLGTVIPDDFVHAYASTTTVGAGWQINGVTALDVDYVHSYANHQAGFTDRNLPPAGALSAANPRPFPQFSQVLALETFTRSWYDALETQLRTQVGAGNAVQVSYTLSRSYLDGVDFFLTQRGTERTPHERGYNPTDQRHNLAASGTVELPWEIQVSGILKLVSGSPIKVQAGVDLDGDLSISGDLPAGVPITVGREQVEPSLRAINELRASRNLAPLDSGLLALDPYRTLDLRVSKFVRLGGGRRLELLIEGFNVTNHVNYRPPNGASMNSSTFLVRTAAQDARQIQWGLRFLF